MTPAESVVKVIEYMRRPRIRVDEWKAAGLHYHAHIYWHNKVVDCHGAEIKQCMCTEQAGWTECEVFRQQRPWRAANEGDGIRMEGTARGAMSRSEASLHLHLLVAFLWRGLCRLLLLLLLLGQLRWLVLVLLSRLLSLWLLMRKCELGLGGVRRVQEADIGQWYSLVVRLQWIVVARCE